jgi:hypothetical protein
MRAIDRAVQAVDGDGVGAADQGGGGAEPVT